MRGGRKRGISPRGGAASQRSVRRTGAASSGTPIRWRRVVPSIVGCVVTRRCHRFFPTRLLVVSSETVLAGRSRFRIRGAAAIHQHCSRTYIYPFVSGIRAAFRSATGFTIACSRGAAARPSLPMDSASAVPRCDADSVKRLIPASLPPGVERPTAPRKRCDPAWVSPLRPHNTRRRGVRRRRGGGGIPQRSVHLPSGRPTGGTKRPGWGSAQRCGVVTGIDAPTTVLRRRTTVRGDRR